MRTTVDLDAHLLKQVREEARRRGISFKEALAGALRRGLAEPAAHTRKYRCPTFRMGRVTGGLSLDKALAIAGELEDLEIADELARRK